MFHNIGHSADPYGTPLFIFVFEKCKMKLNKWFNLVENVYHETPYIWPQNVLNIINERINNNLFRNEIWYLALKWNQIWTINGSKNICKFNWKRLHTANDSGQGCVRDVTWCGWHWHTNWCLYYFLHCLLRISLFQCSPCGKWLFMQRKNWSPRTKVLLCRLINWCLINMSIKINHKTSFIMLHLRFLFNDLSKLLLWLLWST